METMSIDNGKLKDLFKQAMEDLAMVRAIEEGESSGSASRKEIFDILDGKEDSA